MNGISVIRHFGRDCRNPGCGDSLQLPSLATGFRHPLERLSESLPERRTWAKASVDEISGLSDIQGQRRSMVGGGAGALGCHISCKCGLLTAL